MLKWIKNSFHYVKDTFERCLTVPDVNSRLVFLVNSFVIHVIAIWQTGVYLHSSTKDSNYPTILAVLLGAHGVNGLGRLMTKRVGEADETDDAKDDDKKSDKETEDNK